jgi:hypothetical protein
MIGSSFMLRRYPEMNVILIHIITGYIRNDKHNEDIYLAVARRYIRGGKSDIKHI